jgi:DNA-binding NtrC family response regulator
MNDGHRSTPPTLLVADDQRDVRDALRLLLSSEGYRVVLASSPQEALDALKTGPASGHIRLALLDLNYSRDTTSGREGLSLLETLRLEDPDLPLVAMTAWGSVDLAVAAMRCGACDFVEKPWDNTRLLTIIRTHLERTSALQSAQKFRAMVGLQQVDKLGNGLVAESACMREVVELARQVAPSQAPVLITGENGTGKSLLAEWLHRWSGRGDEPFVAVNMGSIPESLFESEMFGHVKGAFTDAREARTGRFELADGGTLFLDEVANLPLAQQAKLLRVLESGCYERVGGSRTHTANVRVLTATNADLPAMIAGGRFRRDLYFRLNTLEIRIPPLRERSEDILCMAQHFLEQQRLRHGRALTLSAQADDALLAHDWPGNVRELAHAVERAVLLARGSQITPADLALRPAEYRPAENRHEVLDGEVMQLAAAERLLIRNALDRFNGDVQEAARALGLSRSAMYRRLEKLGIGPATD